MICLDTTFLIDLWRQKGHAESPARKLIASNAGHEFVVPSHAAGEFLEGGARVSEARLEDALLFVRAFRIGSITLETAIVYARVVEGLRAGEVLGGRSKADMWIAAWSVQHSAPLATRNPKHFAVIDGLEVLEYS